MGKPANKINWGVYEQGVKMPKNVPIALRNKYGNIHIAFYDNLDGVDTFTEQMTGDELIVSRGTEFVALG